MKRQVFLRGATAAAATAFGGAQAARAADLKLSFDKADFAQIAETLRHLRLMHVWRPASAFPSYAPLALYKPRGSDPQHADTSVLWINVDHRELMTPRAGHSDDEDPALAETMIGVTDLPLDLPSWKKLRAVFRAAPPADRSFLALKLVPLVRDSFGQDPATPHVSDSEFAAEAFPFEVVRNMTPGVPGVEVDEPPPGAKMPAGAPLVAYVGRIDVRHHGAPVIWGDNAKIATVQGTPEFVTALMSAYVLATADMQPPESGEKRAYEAARAQDAARGPETFTARNAFAVGYLARVRALVSH